jgi:hypothetical protein
VLALEHRDGHATALDEEAADVGQEALARGVR